MIPSELFTPKTLFHIFYTVFTVKASHFDSKLNKKTDESLAVHFTLRMREQHCVVRAAYATFGVHTSIHSMLLMVLMVAREEKSACTH